MSNFRLTHPPMRGDGRSLTICLISEEFPPEMYGGIATYTLDMARGLVALGHRVHVITRTWMKERRDEQDGIIIHRMFEPEPTWAWGTETLSVKFYESRHIVAWNLCVKRAIDRICEQESLDVMECPEYHAQGLFAALAHRNVPLVVRLHIPAFVCRRLNGVGQGGSDLDRHFSEGIEYRMVRCASLITSPSQCMADDVAGPWGLNRSDIHVIPNPADERLFASANHLSPDPNQVVFTGRLERRKGVDVLARAIPIVLRSHPATKFTFYGHDHPSGPEASSMMEHLRTILGDAIPAVAFAEPVYRSSLPEIYRKAWVCVVPSLYESFGYACLEAMAAGSAVVASRAGSLPELVTDGHDGLLASPDDPQGLAKAIVSVLSNAPLRRSLAQQARRTVVERFARDEVCRRMVAAYRSIVSRAR